MWDEGRRVRMLTWYYKYLLSLEANMRFDMLIAAIDQWSHVSLLPEAREIAPFKGQNMFHKFLKNAGFHLTTGNPSSIVQIELISGYIYCLTTHTLTHTYTKGAWSVTQCYSTCWPLG